MRFWLLWLVPFCYSACTQERQETPEETAARLESQMEDFFHNSLSEEELAEMDTHELDSLTMEATTKGGLLDRVTLEDSLRTLYEALQLEKLKLDYKVFRYGAIGFWGLQQEGRLSDRPLLSIIDFTKSSCEKRFYTLDLETKKVLFYTYVSHGRNTGGDKAEKFGNAVNSNLSSLGFYVTGETYTGSKGYSMRLDGTEKGINDNLRRRGVVVHNADYVSEDWIKKYGRLGRSQGCPALPKGIYREVIEAIKDRTAIFAYFKDDTYLAASRYLKLDELMARFDEAKEGEEYLDADE
ncbi:murein L,D-transpeptidase catalytic domain family protein [Catalinimonas alkaloidigena]|nr:murein L,D-transpeptidase catalytic domain family protein [Catalinimonas alkaloidigena]